MLSSSLTSTNDVQSSSTSTSILSDSDGPNTGTVLGFLFAGVAISSILIIIAFFVYLYFQRKRHDENNTRPQDGCTLDLNGAPSLRPHPNPSSQSLTSTYNVKESNRSTLPGVPRFINYDGDSHREPTESEVVLPSYSTVNPFSDQYGVTGILDTQNSVQDHRLGGTKSSTESLTPSSRSISSVTIDEAELSNNEGIHVTRDIKSPPPEYKN